MADTQAAPHGSSDSIDEQDPNLQPEDKKQKSRRPASEHTVMDGECEDEGLIYCASLQILLSVNSD